MRERAWRPGRPVDVVGTLAPLRHGASDPAVRLTASGAVWRVTRTTEGSATLRVAAAGDEVVAAAWGPGADLALAGLPDLLGARDDLSGFMPACPLLLDLARRNQGLRIPRTGAVLEALAPAVLEQRVTGLESRRAWRALLHRYGDPAPGPAGEHGMRVPPPPALWATLPSWEWHRVGVDPRRARTIASAARAAGRLEQTLELPTAQVDGRLRAVPGIGAWTASEVRQRAHGDADAVSVGDCHLPRLVGWALANEPFADDARMLDLLAPYAGHRHRVVRLLERCGSRVPRFGPRLAPADIRGL